MLRVIARRLLAIVPLLFLISLGTFGLAKAIEGNPAQAIAGDGATQEEIDAVTERLHLDDPYPVRYVRWVGDVATGDLGESVATGRSVSSELSRRFPVTASLAISALVLTFLIGVPLGVLQGMRPAAGSTASCSAGCRSDWPRRTSSLPRSACTCSPCAGSGCRR